MAPAGVVVRSAKPTGFIAGADIKEFLKICAPPRTAMHWCAPDRPCCDSSRICPAPASRPCTDSRWAAAWNWRSPARYRVGADDAKLSLGLPEVLLGIHPGFGGTVRAVRLIGVRPALDLMLKGKPFKGARALAVGLHR